MEIFVSLKMYPPRYYVSHPSAAYCINERINRRVSTYFEGTNDNDRFEFSSWSAHCVAKSLLGPAFCPQIINRLPQCVLNRSFILPESWHKKLSK